MEAGLEFNVSKQVALCGIFKYANVLSSDENQRLNNYGFVNNGYGNATSPDQSVVGGSLAEDSFYSIWCPGLDGLRGFSPILQLQT